MTPMKRCLIFLACAAVIFAAVMLAILLSDSPPPTVRLVFLGYTNTGGQPEALFSVQFPPSFGGCGWKDPEVSRKEGEVWKSWSLTNRTVPRMRYFTAPIKSSPGAPERLAAVFAAFPVETTNDVSRIVIEVDLNPRRESRMTAAARILWGWLRITSSLPSGRSYFLTNETRIKPAA